MKFIQKIKYIKLNFVNSKSIFDYNFLYQKYFFIKINYQEYEGAQLELPQGAKLINNLKLNFMFRNGRVQEEKRNNFEVLNCKEVIV